MPAYTITSPVMSCKCWAWRQSRLKCSGGILVTRLRRGGRSKDQGQPWGRGNPAVSLAASVDYQLQKETKLNVQMARNHHSCAGLDSIAVSGCVPRFIASLTACSLHLFILHLASLPFFRSNSIPSSSHYSKECYSCLKKPLQCPSLLLTT